MSQPIRYGLADEHLGRIRPEQDGHLVMWADYAALAAEVERLRKVGFRLAERLSWCGNLGDRPLIEEWQQITGTDIYNDEEGRDAK